MIRARCPDEHKRLDRFRLESFVQEHGWNRGDVIIRDDDGQVVLREPNPFGSLDRGNGLREAAEAVIESLQRELLQRESPLDPVSARLVARERHTAITALIDLDGHKGAKLTVLRITNNEPLTICTGDRYRIGPRKLHASPPALGLPEFHFTPDGCGAIFVDSPSTNGGPNIWTAYCPQHQNEHSRPPRDQGRALRKRIRAALRNPTRHEVTVMRIRPDDDPPAA